MEFIDSFNYIKNNYKIFNFQWNTVEGFISSIHVNNKILITSNFLMENDALSGFYHELCHFAEIEPEKIFLDNWGLKGTDFPEKSEKSFNKMKKILEREIRVNCFQENVFGNDKSHIMSFKQNMKNYPSLLYMHSNEYREEIDELSSFAEFYWDKMIEIYTKENFWQSFNFRYNLL